MDAASPYDYGGMGVEPFFEGGLQGFVLRASGYGQNFGGYLTRETKPDGRLPGGFVDDRFEVYR